MASPCMSLVRPEGPTQACGFSGSSLQWGGDFNVRLDAGSGAAGAEGADWSLLLRRTVFPEVVALWTFTIRDSALRGAC